MFSNRENFIDSLKHQAQCFCIKVKSIIFDDRNFLLDLYNKQPASSKVGFIAAVILSFLTHFIIYSNLILEAHVPGLSTVPESIVVRNAVGRWFHFSANMMNFHYINWVTGLMQILFLALIVFIIIKAFDIKSRLCAVIIAGIMVTFPAIAETNLAYHDAAPYFMAAFLSIAAFYLTKIYKFGWIFGAVLIMLSLAIYQAKISVAMVACLIHLIIHILKEKPKLLPLIKYALRFLILIAGGLIAYYLSLQILGLSPQLRGMGAFSLSMISEDIISVYREVYFYFFSFSFRIHNQYIVHAFRFLFMTSFVLLIILTIKNGLYRNFLNIALIILLVLLLPIAGNFFRILDRGPFMVIATSSYAFAFYLIIPIVLLDNFRINTFGFKYIISMVLIFVIGYNVVLCNFIYFRAQVLTQHAMLLANRITAQIEPLLPYSTNNEVFINGNLTYNPIYPDMHLFKEYTPRFLHNNVLLGGLENNLWGWKLNFFEDVLRYRVGLNINHLGNDMDRKMYLLNEAITSGMPVYPQEGSIAIIDGVIVSILSFYGRIDIENTAPYNFTATIHHTSKASDLEFEYLWYVYKDGARLEFINPDNPDLYQVSFEVLESGTYSFKIYAFLSHNGVKALEIFSFEIEV